MDRRKALVFTLIGAIALVIVYIVYIWNKPPATVDKQEGLMITSQSLTQAFLDNEQNANALYLNKVVEVTGAVAELSKNQDGKPVVLLAADDPLSGVQCTMRENDLKVEIGETVTLKGFCNGYTTVVLLSDCIKIDDQKTRD